MNPLWCHQLCLKSKPSAQRVAMLNVRRSTIKVQCPMLNVNLLNEQRSTTRAQCTMYSGQRPGCNVQCSMSTCSMYNVQCATSKGQYATYRVQEQCTSTNSQINNQLSTGSTVGSPWSGLRYQFEGSNKCNQSKKQPHEVSSRVFRFGAVFSHQRRHGSSVVTSLPSHLRRSRVETKEPRASGRHELSSVQQPWFQHVME